MVSETEYRKLCMSKLPLVERFADGRNIWIYGAGVCGKILMNVLQENHVEIRGFLDQNADRIKTVREFPVRTLCHVNPENDFIIVSLYAYYFEIAEVCKTHGFTKRDYYFVCAGELFNKEDIVYRGCQVGRYTYGYEKLLEHYPLAEKIGRFCSINGTAKIWNNHPIDYITTHPILDHPQFYPWEEAEKREEWIEKYGRYFENAPFENSPLRQNRPVVIGNDVWIGANVVILPGVHIGNGAILAAGAVITKNVDDYAIVGGVPAKTIRYRFNENEIEKLLRLQWWDWEIDKIMDHLELFYQPKKFLEMDE